MTAQETNPNTIINYRTDTKLKTAFFSLCKSQHTTATSRLNEFMRTTLKEAGWTDTPDAKQQPTKATHDCRDDLIRA